MKIPRIDAGVDILPDVKKGDAYPAEGKIVAVDHVDKLFAISGFKDNWYAFPFEQYNPAPTMNNFLRAITEWDYHYRMADDPRRYEEGKDYEQALIQLFRSLPEQDQQSCRKIVEIVVISATPA